MKTIETHFCNYQHSVKLKELGFNDFCLGVYHRDGSLFSIIPRTTKHSQYEEFGVIKNSECVFESDEDSINGIQEVAAPLKSQAFPFLYSKTGKYIIPIPNDDKKGEWFGCGISYKTYEEAENACLNKLIELCNK